MNVRFLGTDTVVPRSEQDTACLLLNTDTLVDTGWAAPLDMLRYGCDPMAIDYIFITHCHHDHYMALPQLLFYHAMRRGERPDKPPLTIVGPKPDLRDVVDRAQAFLQYDRFPAVEISTEVIPLQAGATFETESLSITTSPAVHPVVGLCYVFREKATGASVGVTGDTAYHEPIARHAAGVDLLVHEASRGPVESDPNARGGHSGSIDAARIAAAANAKRLYLYHYNASQRDAILTAAREVFPETYAAAEGEELELPISQG